MTINERLGGDVQPDETAGIVTPPNNAKEYTVLVVDDNDQTRGLFKTIIESISKGRIKVITAAGGAEVLTNIRGKNPDYQTIDLMITDILMPGMDGYQFLQFFRAENQGQYATKPVIVATAIEPTRVNYALLANLNVIREDILYKPIGIDRIKEVVAKYCKGAIPNTGDGVL